MVHRHGIFSTLTLLVLLVVAAPSVRTEPVYNNFSQDSVLCRPGQTIPLDIDLNGTVDFLLYCNRINADVFLHVNIPPLLVLTNKVGVSANLNLLGDPEARPYGLSDLISGDILFNGLLQVNGPLLAQPSSAGPDLFEGHGNVYVGVCFARNGAVHYGWIKVNVNAAGDTLRVLATAYENLPGVGIVIGEPSPTQVAVQQISVHGTGGATAITNVGGSLQMVVDVLPADATNKNVNWSVNNNAVATVSAGGLVTAIANGAVTVTATATDGSGISGSATIAVSNQTQVVQVSGITVGSVNGQMTITMPGGTLGMTAEVMPANATNKNVTWSVDNSAVAMIDAGGVLHAISDGMVTVKAMAADGSGISGSAVVSVTGQTPTTVAVTKITVRSLTGETTIGSIGGTLALTADVEPANATNSMVMWSVDNGGIATIDALGMLRGNANGNVMATATALDGSNVSGSLAVNVNAGTVASVTGLMDAGATTPRISVTGDLLTIRLPESAVPVEIAIYDVVGRNVARHATDGTGRLMMIDCSSLPAGMYLVSGRSAGATFAERMVLTR